MEGIGDTLSRRRFLVLCASGVGVAAASALVGSKVVDAERADPGEAAESALARLDPKVVAAARQQDWFVSLDANHVRLLEWLAAGSRNMGGLDVASPAVGSTFGKTDVPIGPAGPLDTERQLAIIEQNLFMFLNDRPVVFSSDAPLSTTDVAAAKQLVATWFPQVEAALGASYPYAGTHVQLNVANASSRATTRGANLWIAPDFSYLPHVLVHERTHSFQYGTNQAVRFPIFASEGSAESMATLLTATPALWHGDNVEVNADLTASSPEAAAAYGEQSFNGYQLFADLLKLTGKPKFMKVMQQMHAGSRTISGEEVLGLFKQAVPDAAAVDALYERSVMNYARLQAAVSANG